MKTILRLKNGEAILDGEIIKTEQKFDVCESIFLPVRNVPDQLTKGDTITLSIFDGGFGSLSASHWDATNGTRSMNCMISEKQFKALKQKTKPLPNKTLKGKTLDWELPEQDWE